MLPRANAAKLRPAAPRPARRGAVAVAIGALAIGAAPLGIAAASADEPLEPIVLRYEAEAGCPDAAEFGGEVRGRASRARLADPGERARTFTVRITRAGRTFRGPLEVRETAGDSSARDVSGASCAEVASALALVTALAIDPQAATAPRVGSTFGGAASSVATADAGAEAARDASPDAPPPHAPADAAAPPDAAALDPALDAALDGSTPDAVAPPEPPIPRPALPRAPPDPGDPDPYAGRAVRLFVGLSYAATTGLARELSGAPGAFIEVGLPPRGAIAPTLRLAIDRVSGASLVAPGGWLARFDRTRVELDACAVRLPIGPLDLAPCVAFGAGVVAAEGRVAREVVSRTRPWVDAELGARARLWLLDRVSIEVDGGVSFPFVRDTFVFDPTTTIDRTPAAAAFVAGAAAVRFY